MKGELLDKFQDYRLYRLHDEASIYAVTLGEEGKVIKKIAHSTDWNAEHWFLGWAVRHMTSGSGEKK